MSPAAQKPINRPGWWKGKLALFQMPATEGGGERGLDICPRASATPHHPQLPRQAGSESFHRQSEGEKQYSQLTVIFELVIAGLTSLILVALSTVNLRFQGPFVPISLWSLLRIMVAYVLVVIMQLTSSPRVLVSIRRLTGYGSE